MDAHVAVIISEYLPIHLSNVFLSMLGLSEHVITHDMVSSGSVAASRCTEAIACLGYPSQLIVSTRNFHAAVEALDDVNVRVLLDQQSGMAANNIIKMLSSDFDRLGDYVRSHPWATVLVITKRYDEFRKYILGAIDARYTDFAYVFPERLIPLYKPFPEWSLNYFMNAPTTQNVIDIIIKLRYAPKAYFVCQGSGLVSYAVLPQYSNQGHRELFRRYFRKVDDVHALSRATFDGIQDFNRWIDSSRSNISLTPFEKELIISSFGGCFF